MVTQFSSVCLNRRRDDKFLEYDTDFKKGHMKEKCFQCSLSTCFIETSPFLR